MKEICNPAMQTVEVFKPIFLTSLELENKFIRSATDEALASLEGEPTEELSNFMRRMAIYLHNRYRRFLIKE